MQIINKIKKILKIGVLPYQIKPPYTHVVQIGDPILRNTAKEVNPETIKKPEFQKVNISSIVVQNMKQLLLFRFISVMFKVNENINFYADER